MHWNWLSAELTVHSPTYQHESGVGQEPCISGVAARQAPPSAHTMPQPPQLLGSFKVFEHPDGHMVSPAGQLGGGGAASGAGGLVSGGAVSLGAVVSLGAAPTSLTPRGASGLASSGAGEASSGAAGGAASGPASSSETTSTSRTVRTSVTHPASVRTATRRRIFCMVREPSSAPCLGPLAPDRVRGPFSTASIPPPTFAGTMPPPPPPPPEPPVTNPPDEILKYFKPELAEVSKRFAELAHWLAATLPRGAERATALRKLLEGKDAAVRAALP